MNGADVINFGFGGIPRTYTGTHTVVDPNAKTQNCAFIATLSEHMYMVVASDGKVLEAVNTNPGVNAAFSAQKK